MADKVLFSEISFHRFSETAEAEGDHVHVPFQQFMFSLVVGHVIAVSDAQVATPATGKINLPVPAVQLQFQPHQVVQRGELPEIIQLGVILYLIIRGAYAHSSDAYERQQLEISALIKRIV